MKKIFLTLTLLLSSLGVHAECPSNLTYNNGRSMLSGSNLYYPNGRYLKSGSTLYYPNGTYLKSGSSVYYPSGRYLKSGSNIYYPSGRYLKSGSNLYYSNGSYLKSGTSFYHRNGRYARSGRTLYRETGELTTFPLHLTEAIGEMGTLHAKIMADTEKVYVQFKDLIKSDKVTLRTINNILADSTTDTNFVFIMKTGNPGEAMQISISDDGDLQCDFEDDWEHDQL